MPARSRCTRSTAKNVDQYADKLTEGTKALIKAVPAIAWTSTRPTAASRCRSTVLENTVKNATAAKLSEDGLAARAACTRGIPFPIPKTGAEAMWNHLLRYQGTRFSSRSSHSYNVDSSAGCTLATTA